MSGDLRALRVQESDCLVKFEGNTADLLMLARGVVRGDNVDPGQLCRAAIAVMETSRASGG
jgi:hypothetical protein